jgi:hypothetical protein
MMENKPEQNEEPPSASSRGSIVDSIRGSIYFSTRQIRLSYEGRKDLLLDAKEDFFDVYDVDEDSPLFDVLDTMLFGKLNDIVLNDAKSKTNTSAFSHHESPPLYLC